MFHTFEVINVVIRPVPWNVPFTYTVHHTWCNRFGSWCVVWVCVEFVLFYHEIYNFTLCETMVSHVRVDRWSWYTTTWLLHQPHGWLCLDLQRSFYHFIDLCIKSWVMFPSISRTTGLPTFIHWNTDGHHDHVRPFCTPLDPFSYTCKIRVHLIQLIPQILQHGSSQWRSLHICLWTTEDDVLNSML